MVQNLWRGGGLRICCCSHVYLDMEWLRLLGLRRFCCRDLAQIQEDVTAMAEHGNKRPSGPEAEDRAIRCFLVELPETFPCAGAA